MGRVLDDSEVDVFDAINKDYMELTGVEVNYYAYNAQSPQNRRNVDPLYGERTVALNVTPAKIMASVRYPDYEPLTEESGYSREWDAKVVISRAHLDEKHLPYPSEDDVIELWRTPYHDIASMGKGMFFDVIKARNDGHINDTPTFTQFELTLKRRSQFGAERRITPP